jgi:hypothetical protein
MKLAGPECSIHENELFRCGDNCCVPRRAALIDAGCGGWQMHPVSIPKSNNRQRGVDANDKASDWHTPVGSSTVTIMGGVTTEFVPSEKANQLDYNSELTFEIG